MIAVQRVRSVTVRLGDQDGAGAALAFGAAFLAPGVARVAQPVQQGHMAPDLAEVSRLTVDDDLRFQGNPPIHDARCRCLDATNRSSQRWPPVGAWLVRSAISGPVVDAERPPKMLPRLPAVIYATPDPFGILFSARRNFLGCSDRCSVPLPACACVIC